MIEKRKNILGKDLSKYAEKVFTDAISCKYHLIFSDWMFIELGKHSLPGSTEMLMKLCKQKIINLGVTNEDKEKAKKLSEEHPDDALHVVLAEKAGADVIVTSNTQHFNTIQTNIPITKPRNL